MKVFALAALGALTVNGRLFGSKSSTYSDEDIMRELAISNTEYNEMYQHYYIANLA